jgi:hypothetical protein
MLQKLNGFIRSRLTLFEMIGVGMRIFSFSLVGWMGSKSPFMLVWIVNGTDAVLLTWCATLKKDRAYIVLNTFWILVAIMGALRAGGWLGS